MSTRSWPIFNSAQAKKVEEEIGKRFGYLQFEREIQAPKRQPLYDFAHLSGSS